MRRPGGAGRIAPSAHPRHVAFSLHPGNGGRKQPEIPRVPYAEGSAAFSVADSWAR
jgi:hypothetical protein